MFSEEFDTRLLCETPSPYGRSLDDYFAHIRLVNEGLSEYSKGILEDLKQERIKYYQFKGLPPIENLPETPVNYIARIPTNTYESEGIIGAAAIELGRLFNYRETSEYLMYDIYPVCSYEDTRSFVNSRRMLSFHTDGSAHPEISPDFVLLYCLRSDASAKNLFVDVSELLAELDDDVVQVLMRPLFRHLVSQEPERYVQKPVLYKSGNDYAIQYDEDNTYGLGPRACWAQDCLNKYLRRHAVTISNDDNSLLILNNRLALHARTSFKPAYNGKDRWIKCAFVTRRSIVNGSIIELNLGKA